MLQSMMTDTTHYRDGTPMPIPQPNPKVWWDETRSAGKNAVADQTPKDLAIWMTYAHNYSLGALDTLHFWTVLSTTRNGSLADLEAQVQFAKGWYVDLTGCRPGGCVSCCCGQTGNANGQGGDTPTIGDVSVMIDAKFITGACVKNWGTPEWEMVISCMQEADVNQSGGVNPTCQDITISDISILIDLLFIGGKYHPDTNPDGVDLPRCP